MPMLENRSKIDQYHCHEVLPLNPFKNPLTVELTINGQKHKLKIDASKNLLEVLRDDLNLTGAKYGCGEGQCGACTILVEGRPVRSCITPAANASGREIITIEGLEQNGQLHPVQQAFLTEDAFQCAYCTSGMIMSGVALLKRNPQPSRRQIINAMQGNICRCGAHPRIIDAITLAAKARKDQVE
jgi:aerobic-type carbon monoxide dehydrogenase small subunit (CoxS/CutS family)